MYYDRTNKHPRQSNLIYAIHFLHLIISMYLNITNKEEHPYTRGSHHHPYIAKNTLEINIDFERISARAMSKYVI